jgi:hypothetical protein
MRVLTEFVRESLGEEQMMEIMRSVMPVLLEVVKDRKVRVHWTLLLCPLSCPD